MEIKLTKKEVVIVQNMLMRELSACTIPETYEKELEKIFDKTYKKAGV